MSAAPSGALGAEYKRRNPGCRYLGIERDPDAARLAASRLDEVITADVEAEPAAVRPRPVRLHHLWRRAGAHARSLGAAAPPCRGARPDGHVLVCMPNAEHWSFAERLLRGTWDYETAGLFDRTHLRWFTCGDHAPRADRRRAGDRWT